MNIYQILEDKIVYTIFINFIIQKNLQRWNIQKKDWNEFWVNFRTIRDNMHIDDLSFLGIYINVCVYVSSNISKCAKLKGHLETNDSKLLKIQKISNS